MEQYYPIIEKCLLFQNINKADYSHLLACTNSHLKHFNENQFVFFAGDKINYIVIVLAGSVELSKENAAGERHIINFLTSTQIFGEGIAYTVSHISPVTVRTTENSSLLFLPYERLFRSCGNACSFHTQLIQNLLLLLAEKNKALHTKIELLSLKGMREKLATYLLSQSKQAKSLTFQIRPNRNELAEYLNVSRTSMCRELARMKEEQLIDYYQNSFRILSQEKMNTALTNRTKS